MLDLCLQGVVPESVWSGLTEAAEPHNEQTTTAHVPTHEERTRKRVPLLGRAIVQRSQMYLGVQLRDLSHCGIGFVAPLQLFPQERVVVRLHDDLRLSAVVRRCHRQVSKSYICGCDFTPGPLSVPEFRKLAQLLKSAD